MNYEKALNLMENGRALLSKVSETVYEMKGNLLLAEGLEVSNNYITEKEKNGDWEEVRIVSTKEQFDKLSEKEIENILHSAYKKHQFDNAER